MQKTLFFLLAFLVTTTLSAQQLIVEAFSAYNLTAYDNDNLNQGSYFPLGLRVAGGHEYVQLGLEYRQSITSPELEFKDNPRRALQHDERYYGALVRVNISSLPVYRAGLVLKGGAGFYNYEERQIETDNNLILNKNELGRQLGYNAGAGLSLPIYGMFHLEIGWQYNMVGRDAYVDEGLAMPEYDANYHSFQFGFSTNFMFGKKSVECKNRKHRKRGRHGREGWYRN
ncbi:MAG: hypothetical protein AB8F74_01550 [Saprospiraceae bacterium]